MERLALHKNPLPVGHRQEQDAHAEVRRLVIRDEIQPVYDRSGPDIPHTDGLRNRLLS